MNELSNELRSLSYRVEKLERQNARFKKALMEKMCIKQGCRYLVSDADNIFLVYQIYPDGKKIVIYHTPYRKELAKLKRIYIDLGVYAE